ncbi:MAG: AAA family ATPase [Clostridia bacterium]|nr:AAA family ATPase [Clostridia bacterium]
MIKNIKISNWRQFYNIDIDFDSTLTVLTGANGAGKTTILDIISYLFGFNYSYTGVPKRDSFGELVYSNSIKNIGPLEIDLPNTYKSIGELSYISNRSRN